MITSVYGSCDKFGVVFEQKGGVWRCRIPPDWTDGQYVCEFVAIGDSGLQGYWTGILYIPYDQRMCPELIEDIFTVWLLPDEDAAVLSERYTADLITRQVTELSERFTTELIRREHNVADNATA